MTREEVIKLIRDEVEIEVNNMTEYGPTEIVQVSLWIGDEKISEDDCSIPSCES